MDERKEDENMKAFQDDIKYFLSKENFNLYDFHERVLVSFWLLGTFLTFNCAADCA